MTVTIPKDLEAYIQSQVASGQCESEQALIAQAIRVYRELHEKHAELQRSVQEGFDQIERGEYIELKDESEIRQFFDDISTRGRARLGIGTKP